MAKKQFKAESKRLLDLMIHSIYTHREIFLRELISNASDALDKLSYRALTDDTVALTREDLRITLTPDEESRTLTVSDNGIGMTKGELEENLGTIAKSGSLQFKGDLPEGADVDIIGQFGVGFYAAFMVAERVEVVSRAYGSDEAWRWVSAGADGYSITSCGKEGAGTDIILHLKPDGEEEDYSRFVKGAALTALVKRFSDYIRYPIVMGEETLNSMIPLWQRPKSKVTREEYDAFYKEKFGDYEAPLGMVYTAVEGAVSYKALLYIPARAPFDFYTREYEKGLQLYTSGVLIMDRCADLLPDHFRFVRGVVDSQDFSLNLSREVLQHDRQLKIVAANLEKKIKAELLRIQKEERENYEKFWAAFGAQIKYGIAGEYGAHKEQLRDLLLFPSSSGNSVSLAEYRAAMPEGQEFVYYVRAENGERAAKLPQTERILDAGYAVLWLTEEVDEFVVQILGEVEGKPFKSVSEPDALPESEEEKSRAEAQAEESRDVLDFVKETLGDKVHAVRLSKILKSAPVCLTAEGPISLDMEKYFEKLEGAPPMRAQRVLELNGDSGAFAALRDAVERDRARAATYAEVLYHQALLIAGLPIDDPAEYTRLVCSLLE